MNKLKLNLILPSINSVPTRYSLKLYQLKSFPLLLSALLVTTNWLYSGPASAQSQPSPVTPSLVTPSSSSVSIPSIPILMSEQIFSIYENEVKLVQTDAGHRQEFINLAAFAVKDKNLDKSQYILIVDRNTKRQVASLGFYNAEKKTLDVSSFTLVATGAVKKGKFITPLGWFEHVVSNGSYRAEGSKNENGIRGYGRKGMRVWDLGWHNAQASWIKDERLMPIRFQLHATDPDFLEPKLGTPGSQGCVRMSATLNQFLDKYGILDSNFEAVNYWALRRDRTPAQMAGSQTLVIETSPVVEVLPPPVAPILTTVPASAPAPSAPLAKL